MAEPSRKKRLTLSLSFFTNLSESRTPNVNLGSMNSAKSPRNFERGVVGLGIVAAMNDPKDRSDSMISAKTSRTATFALSPRSQPIPISVPSSVKPGAVSIGGPSLEKGNMEHSESYTCVILNVGNNLIKKREYFDDKVDGCSGATGLNSGMFSASPLSHGKGNSAFAPFRTADFLHSCYLCKRALHGLDIFMYRGEKAFCSAECRYKQISSHETGRCSASPCSSPTMFYTRVAVA